MKHKLSITAIATIFILGISFTSDLNSKYTRALESIHKTYHDNRSFLASHIEEYNRIANAFEHQEDIQQLQEIHSETRLAFKRIEYLFEYLDPAGVKQSINGAPLPKTEAKVADMRIIKPKGLQILDELVYGDAVVDDIEIIRSLVSKLLSDYTFMNNYQSSIALEHRHIFEAARQELIRVFALGVTGFDTPGSSNAIKEANMALTGVKEGLTPYLELIADNNLVLSQSIDNNLKGALLFLENNSDFDTFDRMTFLKSFINPLYKALYQAHRELNIETWKDAGQQLPAINYSATNIFDEDFLSTEYYSGLTSNPYSELRKGLGKKLFNDAILSKNLDMSCSSCHNSKLAFTDGLARSNANVKGKKLLRNAPTLINSVYAEKYFLDLRESIFEKQMIHVIHNELEFDTDFISLIDRLNEDELYVALFDEAYPDQGVSKHGITNSLSNYVASLTSFDSPVDQYIRGENEGLSPAAIRGFNLFMGKGACGTCHFAPTFSGTVPPLYTESESEVLGVPATTDTINPVVDEDFGRIANLRPLDEAEFYRYSFKTTTTRNVEFTGPYMHNGVYKSLDEVVHFYNIGGGNGLGLDLEYQTLPFDSLGLSMQEESDLVAFMEALSDESVVADSQ